jgi:hypothetical protein
LDAAANGSGCLQQHDGHVALDEQACAIEACQSGADNNHRMLLIDAHVVSEQLPGVSS